MTKEQLFAENMRRKNIQQQLLRYNPITGGGSLEKRKRVFFPRQDIALHLPVDMFRDERLRSVLDNVSLDRQEVSDEVFVFVNFVREAYDFEYYAYKKIKIQDKESGAIIPFVMNYPQRLLHREVEKGRVGGVPLRYLIVKARQWGGSTYIQCRFFWLQNKIQMGANSVIITMVDDQARRIRGMYNRICKYHPDGIKMHNFEGSAKTKIIKDRESVISIGSVERPDNIRSENVVLAHLSEVGLWRKTRERNPEDLIQTIRGSVLDRSGTEIFLESTAKGVGNFFHNEYVATKEQRSNYKVFFMGWQDIFHLYRKVIKEPRDAWNLYQTFTDYERWLWTVKGCTLEQIYWYRNKLRDFKGDVWRMRSEFPTDIDEAFSATGARFFPKDYITAAEAEVREPVAIGEMVSKHAKGKLCLKEFGFVEHREPVGEDVAVLKVWKFPDKKIRVKNRYMVVMDVGGRWAGADNTVILVLDRYWRMYGGGLEVVATWVGHGDYDLLAWKAAQIAAWYNQALLVIESNTIDKDKNRSEEGDNSLTVLNEIADYYSKLYTRTHPERIAEGAPVQWGFHTNRTTRPLILNALLFALRDGLFTERERAAIDEYDQFQVNDRGRPEAVEGCHDDRVLARAIGVFVDEEYDAPVALKEGDGRVRRGGMVSDML